MIRRGGIVKKNNTSPRKRIISVVVVTIFFIISMRTVESVYTHIAVTVSPSMKKRVYWIERDAKVKEIARGTYIMFSVPPYAYELGQKTTTAIKRVECAGGDVLRVVGDAYYCDGNYLGNRKNPRSFIYGGVIPSDKVFVMGDHPDSYDSRQFGFVKKVDVIAVVTPIF
jgi:type IV secretory pathway protease TraF